MSRAFVKESDGDGSEDIPELAISPHRNLVTPAGLAHIEETLRRLEGELSAARAAEDRGTAARVERDLRYWTSRRSTAEVIDPVVRPETVRFGCTVELHTGSGERSGSRSWARTSRIRDTAASPTCRHSPSA